MKNQSKAYLFTALSILCWATVATAFKLALRDISPVQLLFISTISSTLLLSFLALISGKFRLIKAFTIRDYALSALMGLINPFAYYLILFEAYRLLPAQIAQPLNCTWGIVIVFLSIPILKQQVRWYNFLSLCIGLLGVSVIAYGGEMSLYLNISVTGVLLALSSSVVWSVYWLINAGDKKDEVVRLLMNFIFGSIFITLFYLLQGGFHEWNGEGLLPAVYVGVFEMGLTFWFWLQALRYSQNTAKISIYIYIFPILSLIFIHFFLGEKILLTSVAGLILVIFGVVFNRIMEMRAGSRIS